jgi:hypothetical protein
MLALYAVARRVLMWLGPAENESDDALTLFKSLSKGVEVNWNRQRMWPSSQHMSEDWADWNTTLPFVAGELILVWSFLQ